MLFFQRITLGAGWWQEEQAITQRLQQPGVTLSILVDEVAQSPPETVSQALSHLSIYSRAGMTTEAIHTLRSLRRIDPQIDSQSLAHIFDGLAGREAWDIDFELVEVFENEIDWHPIQLRPLTQHLLSAGWSPERVDRWLREQPLGKNGFWVRARGAFLASQQQIATLLQELENNARDQPEDMEAAILYLTVLTDNSGTFGVPRPDLAWIADSCRPNLATDMDRLGTLLSLRSEFKLAAGYFEKAALTPLTEAEIPEQASPIERSPASQLRASFHVRCLERLAHCLSQVADDAGANRAFARAAGVRRDLELAKDPAFPGTGRPQDVVVPPLESFVEHSNPSDWQSEARRYSVLENSEGEEFCLRAALEMCGTQLGQRFHEQRGECIEKLAMFLAGRSRRAEAIDLLKSEMLASPADSRSSPRAASILRMYFGEELKFDDDAIWTWLDLRQEWTETERLFVYQMTMNADPVERDGIVSRAEALTFHKHPSRAKELAWETFQRGYADVALRLAADAFERSAEQDRAESALIYFRVSLDQGDWRTAQDLYPMCSRIMPPQTPERWLYELSTLAAQAGAARDALQIWKQAANVNLQLACRMEEGSTLQLLVEEGLKPELIMYFSELQDVQPQSDIPPAVLSWLVK